MARRVQRQEEHFPLRADRAGSDPLKGGVASRGPDLARRRLVTGPTPSDSPVEIEGTRVTVAAAHEATFDVMAEHETHDSRTRELGTIVVCLEGPESLSHHRARNQNVQVRADAQRYVPV